MSKDYYPINKVLKELNISVEDASLALNSHGLEINPKIQPYLDSTCYAILKDFFYREELSAENKKTAVKNVRLNKVLRECNISMDRAVDYLLSKGHEIDPRPTTKINEHLYRLILEEFSKDKSKNEAKKVSLEKQREKRTRIKVTPKQKEKKIKTFKKAPLKKKITEPKSKYQKNLSKARNIERGQHRLFKVKEHKETVTILEDLINSEEHAYKKINLKEGAKLALFVEDVSPSNKCRFQFSIINKFEKGLEYEFCLKEKKENGFLINHGDYYSFIPLGFKDLFENEKIKLRVNDLDFNKNNLFYDSPFSNKKDPNQLFSAGEVYEFDVYGSFESDYGSTILLLEKDGFKATVKAMDFQTEKIPEKVSCYVKEIDGDKIRIIQDRNSLLSSVYKKGGNYEFEVIAIKKDENSGEDYYLLGDEFGFNHRFFINEYIGGELDADEIGKVKQFHVKKIEEKGHLILYINTSEEEGKFYSVEELFENIGFSTRINPLFFNFREKLEEERYQKQSYSNLFDDYDHQENLWIFSYLSFIEFYKFELFYLNDWDLAIELTELYIAIEEWMLEGSDFLSNFGQEKKDLTIQKAEGRLEKAKYELQALKMVADKNGKSFIEEINQKINKSGYLRADNLGVFKALLRINPDLLESNDSEIVSVLVRLLKEGRLEKYEYSHYMGILEKRLAREKYHLNFSLIKKKHQEFDLDTLGSIKDILRLMALQIYLANESGNSDYSIIKSATLLRYLSFLSKDKEHKQNLLNHAITIITKNKSLSLKLDQIEDIDQFRIERESNENGTVKDDFNAELFFNYGGTVYSTNTGIALVSPTQNYIFNKKRQVQLSKNGSYFDDRILIGGLDPELKLNDLNDFEQYRKNWKSYFAKVVGDLKENREKAALPEVGDIVKAKVKNFHKSNNNLVFLQIIDEKFSGEGILHIRETSKVFLDGLDGIIYSGEIFDVKVVDKTNGRLSFGLTDQVWQYGKQEFEEDGLVNGKVANISNGFAFIMCENGLPASCFIHNNDFKLLENQVYKFKISAPDNQDHEYYNAEYISDSDVYFDQKRVYREFIQKYVLEDNEEPDLDYNSKSKFKLIYELVLVVENILALEDKPEKKLEYLYLAKFLTSILKHHRSYYFDAQINFLHQTDVFKKLMEDETFQPNGYVESQTIENFESLQLINDYYRVLEHYNKKNVMPDLLELKNLSNNNEVSKLIHSVLAYNLIKDEFPEDKETLKRTKNLIYSHISNEKLNSANELLDPLENQSVEIDNKIDEEINLGIENKVKEFKTSFIFYAGSNSADLTQQSNVILKVIAGFLNQSGGTLYLGVNDAGEVIGLEEDYKHFNNADKYERIIRKHIVNAFNKDINGVIDFEFQKSKNNEFLAIQIPQYDEPVALGNEFYQRQGNETRILKGDDLSKFFKRKFSDKTD